MNKMIVAGSARAGRELPMDSTAHVKKGTSNNEAKALSLGGYTELRTNYKHHGCYHENATHLRCCA